MSRMKKIYHLKTCSTCVKIIHEVNPDKEVVLQNIKVDKITPEQLDEMAQLAGSYEALFSRKSTKYKALALADKKITEKEYRQLILDEYTFLRRPVSIIENEIFIGNAKAVTEALKNKLHK